MNNTNNLEAIGKRISLTRRAKGMTQENLAEKLGVSPPSVSALTSSILLAPQYSIAFASSTLIPIISNIYSSLANSYIAFANIFVFSTISSILIYSFSLCAIPFCPGNDGPKGTILGITLA